MANAHHDDHDPAEPAVYPDGELYGVLAEFDTPGELLEAARKVKSAGYTEFDTYSPFPVHGMDDAMGIKRTILPLIVFGGGLTGLLGGVLLQWWMNAYNWPWNIAGKPSWSIPANVPTRPLSIAIGPPALPLVIAAIASRCSGFARSSIIRPTDQFPLIIASGVRPSTMKPRPSSVTLSNFPRST